MKLIKKYIPGILLFSSMILAQSLSDNFGLLQLQIGNEQPEEYLVRSAILYKGVSIEYDTTLHVSNNDSTGLYFYPQLYKGTQYVLHLILESKQKSLEGPSVFYDFYLNLGDSIGDVVTLSGVDSNAFFLYSGRFTNDKLYSRNCEGQFELTSNAELSWEVEGNFRVTFEFPVHGLVNGYEPVSIHGNLIIPESRQLIGEETNLSPLKNRKKNLKRNLYIAIFTSLFIVAFVLR